MKLQNVPVWFWAVLLVLLAVPALLSSLSLGFFPMTSDETTFAWAGARLAKGDVPYRDYFAIIPPGSLALVAGWFDLWGQSLGALRWAQLLIALALSLLLHLNLSARKVPAWLSAGASLCFAWLYFPFWPIPSHHYFAITAALGALLAAPPEDGGEGALRRGGARWLLAGGLAGFACLTLQTEGTLAVGWLLMQALWKPGRWRNLALFTAGLAVAGVSSAALLAALGAFPAAWDQLVLWPLKHYRQPGGFNDVAFFSSLGEHFQAQSGGPGDPFPPLRRGILLLAMIMPAGSLLTVGFAAYHKRERIGWLRVAQAAWLLALLLAGRAGWVHLALWCPFALLLAVESAQREGLPEWVPLAWTSWAGAAFFLCLLAWVPYWFQKPPAISGPSGADRWLAEKGPPAVVALLPGAVSRPPILSLPYGSSLYFQYAPDPPPLDWVMPPSSKFNPQDDYEMLANWCTQKKVPFVLIHPNFVQPFLEDPSPLKDVLNRDYHVQAETQSGLLMARNSPKP